MDLIKCQLIVYNCEIRTYVMRHISCCMKGSLQNMRIISGATLQASLNLMFFSHCFSDIDGLGSSAIGGQLIRRASSSSFTSNKKDNNTVLAGTVYVFQHLPVCLCTPFECVYTQRRAGAVFSTVQALKKHCFYDNICQPR